MSSIGPIPEDEVERLAALNSYHVLDTFAEDEFDRLTSLACYICQTPIAFISLVDQKRQWFKSKIGVDLKETSRDSSFCQYTIMHEGIFEVTDSHLDERFKESLLVTDAAYQFRFYAGIPLKSPEGYNIGSLCVIDTRPKKLSTEQKAALETLGHQVMALFELKRISFLKEKELEKTNQEKIDLLEENLNAYKEALDETAIVAITDQKGIINYVNKKFCEISKYSEEELIGQDHRIVNSGFQSKQFIKNLWDTITNGNIWKGIVRNKAKDGSFYWVDATIVPFVDKEGKPYRYVAIRQDITEKIKNEQSLKLYEDIVKNMKAGLFVWQMTNEDPLEFTLVTANPSVEDYIGYNVESLIGKTMKEIFPSNGGSIIPQILKETIVNQRAINLGEFPYGGVRVNPGHFSFTSFPLPDQLVGVTFENITERKKIEYELIAAKEKAEQSVEIKNRFLSNMSHEIRTPMNAIIGFNDLLLQSNLDNTQREYSDAIKTAGSSLLLIINDILDFSKIESGKVVIESKSINLKENFKTIFTLLKLKAKEKLLDFDLYIDTTLPDYLKCDDVHLNQVMINLIENAIKFTEKGGITISVKCVSEDEISCRLRLSVIDSGIGIADDKKEIIFQRFSQANNEATRKLGGTGLGLSIAKHLVKLMGGELKLKSELGKGSEFWFELNCKKVTEGDMYPIQKELEIVKSNISAKILLCEDNVLNQKLEKIVLTNFGFEVVIAENGKIALEKLQNNRYDLILMDLQMPEMDGYQATVAIRNELKLSIPIIAMTAHSLLGEREKCLAMGMNEYVGKPFNQEELFTTIVKTIQMNESKGRLEGKLTPSFNINLDYLHNLSKGNKEFEIEMLNLFLIEVPRDIDSLVHAYDDSSFSSIRNIAHKLKSSVSLVGLDALAPYLNEVETSANNKEINQRMLEKINFVATILTNSCDELLKIINKKQVN